MKVTCCLCGDEIDIDVDDYIEENSDTKDEYFCDECAEIAYEYCLEMALKRN